RWGHVLGIVGRRWLGRFAGQIGRSGVGPEGLFVERDLETEQAERRCLVANALRFALCVG
ncbi:MAG TPA: hypothetical protein VM915_11925, partial [Verrucomicrobiae bacterium]|nr:hypothetical protein [Verrucomicrobiae bacterium]